jgi:hypothetical protein
LWAGKIACRSEKKLTARNMKLRDSNSGKTRSAIVGLGGSQIMNTINQTSTSLAKSKSALSNRYIAIALVALLAILSSQLPSHADPGTAFTYQGLLNASGSAATGSYDFTFNLFDASSGGSPVLPAVSRNGVTVNSGLFTTSLDFGAVLTGTRYWVEIAARPNGGGSYQTISPRVELTPVPYAIYAESAGLANGTAVRSLNGLTDVVTLTAGANVTINTTGNNIQISASGGGGGLTLPFSQSASSAGALFSLNNIATSGPGPEGIFAQSQISTGVHAESGSGWGIYAHSASSHGAFGQSSGGGSAGVLGRYDGFGVGPGGQGVFGYCSQKGVGVLGVSETGDGVSGRSNHGGNSGVFGYTEQASGFGVYGVNTAGGQAGHFDGHLFVSGVESFGTTTRQMLNLFGGGSLGGGYGIGVQNATLYQRSDYGFAWYAGGTHSDYQNDPGIFGTTLMTLASDGTLSCKVLTINGADVAEPFAISTKDAPKGSVVIIDQDNPGQLKLSEHAYDQRVAGILSGANGVRAGICLSQQGFNDGGQNVALSGRVYVLADATYGAIKPGDLLTTSDTPGHAMRVTDQTKAQGAMIGKAMGALPEGKGVVLVLVTLQ